MCTGIPTQKKKLIPYRSLIKISRNLLHLCLFVSDFQKDPELETPFSDSAQPLLLAPQNVSPPGTTGLITETITKVGALHAFEQSAPHSPITKTLKRSPHSAISMLCVTKPKTKRDERNE